MCSQVRHTITYEMSFLTKQDDNSGLDRQIISQICNENVRRTDGRADGYTVLVIKKAPCLRNIYEKK